MKKKLLVSLSALILTAALVLTAVVSPVSTDLLNGGAIGTAKEETTYAFQEAGFKNVLDYIVDRDGFLYGVDYMFNGEDGNNMHHDLGHNHISNYAPTVDFDSMRRDFYNLKQLGFSALNYWVLIHYQGVNFNEEGLAVSVDDEWLNNIRKMLTIAREVGICVVPTLGQHDNLGLGHPYNYGGYEAQMKYARFQWDEEALDAWIKNVTTPLCQVYAEFPDVIPVVNLGIENMTGWVDDYDLGLFQYGKNGTTLELYSNYYNALNATAKKYIPNTPTSIEMGGSLLTVRDGEWTNRWERLYLQNELKVDFICENFYHSGGGIDSRANAFALRPGYIGEFDVEGWQTNTPEEVLTQRQHNSYINARKNGWFGAFFFGFFNDRIGYGGVGSRANYETWRPFLTTWHISMREQISQFKGVDTINYYAKPLFYQGGKNVYWINADGVTSIDVQRSEDGGKTSKTVAEGLKPLDNMCDNTLGKYVDESVEDNKDYAYRIVTHFENGNKTLSEWSNTAKYYVPPNIVKDPSFENGYTSSHVDGWQNLCTDACSIVSGDAHDGEKYLKIDTMVCDNEWCGNRVLVDVEPNKNYKITFWWKSETFYEPGDKTDAFCLQFADPQTNANINAGWFGSTTVSEWRQSSISLNSGNYTQVMLKIQAGNKNQKAILYIDDLDMREVR